jgi:hypothetical protein
MTTRAYFMINVAKDKVGKVGRGSGVVMERELKAIPGVKAVEPVFGIYDLLVTIEAPISEATHSVNKIMEKDWVKRLHILRAEPHEHEERRGGLLLGEALRAKVGMGL